MALKVKSVDVWVASLEDRPGGLAEKLDALSKAGADLAFVLTRRCPDKPGTGVVFLTPLKGKKQLAAAEEAGLRRTESLHSLRVRAADKPGLGSKMTSAMAKEGINLRGLSAAAIGKNAVVYLAFDTAEDADKAASVLKKL